MAERRKRSSLWLHFSELSGEKAKCDICKSTFSFKGGTTSNLRKHLQSKHPTICLEETVPKRTESEASSTSTSTSTSVNLNITTEQGQDVQFVDPVPKSQKQTKIVSYTTIPMCTIRKKKIDYLVLAMVVRDMKPFSIVEDEGFRDLIAALDKSYTLPSRTYLSRELLPRLYDDVVQNVKSALKNAEFITITTDAWTSITTESYMAFTAHFIHDWSMESCLLGCLKFSDRHTAENLKNELFRVVDQWEIRSKVHTIVTDNAANIVAASRLTAWYHWGCTAHTLNLVVKDSLSLETIKLIRNKIKLIIEYFHRSTAAAQKLRSIQAQMNPGEQALKLINDVDTRWNSTLDMFERMIKLQEPLEAAIGVLHCTTSLTIEEWKIVKDSCMILKPFKQSTEKLSAEKYTTISKVIILVKGIKGFLNNFNTVANVESKKFVQALSSNMNKRFSTLEHNKILSRPTFLDSRFKSKAFDDSTALTQVRENVTKSCTQIIPTSASESVQATNQSDQLKEIEDEVLWCNFDKKISESTVTPTSTAIIQVRQYVEEVYLNRKEDPLKWWSSRELIYPALAKQAKRHLGVVATSVPSERVFSGAGEIISKKRSRLSPKNAEKLIFLHANQQYFSKL